MRFRVPPRVRCTSSLAFAAAASWQGGLGRCLRWPTVSLSRRDDQKPTLRLRADPAGLSADFPGIGDRAGVLNGGDRARIPFSSELDGVAVADANLKISEKTGRFLQPNKIAARFAGSLSVFHWGSKSPKSVHVFQAVTKASHRSTYPRQWAVDSPYGTGRLRAS
jgi:hypothetical protein